MQPGDRVIISTAHLCLDNGKSATIIDINPKLPNPVRAQIDGQDVAFWYRQDELNSEVGQLAAEIQAAHQALDALGVPNDGKSSLSERLERMGSSTYTPVAEALEALYETYHATEQPSTWRRAVHDLMKAYDDWLD